MVNGDFYVFTIYFGGLRTYFKIASYYVMSSLSFISGYNS